jgi:transcriptional regulator with XRE-family HTH domain
MGEILTSLADRVNWLFENVLASDNKEYSLQEVEEGTDALGFRVLGASIWKLRQGKTLNPGYLALRSLAKFFNVPTDFFYRDSREITEEWLDRMKIAAQIRNTKVEEIALRASQLNDEGQDALLKMIRLIADRNQSHDESEDSP